MQTAETTTAAPALAPPRYQSTVALDPVYEHHGAQEVTAFGPSQAPGTRLFGRCSLTIETGSASVHLYPTIDEMRALAGLLLEAAGS